jgi:sulfate/thiosulfate transport system permease protein
LPFVVRSVQPVLRELDREAEQAATSLGAKPFVTFRRVILPALVPAIASGCSLAFAKAVGEFGSVVLISGNIPLKTEVASVAIFGHLESNDTAGATGLAVLLLAISLGMLLLIGIIERLARRHEG